MKTPFALALVLLSLVSRSDCQSACGCIDTIMGHASHWAKVVTDFLIGKVKRDVINSGVNKLQLRDIHLPKILGAGISVSQLISVYKDTQILTL